MLKEKKKLLKGYPSINKSKQEFVDTKNLPKKKAPIKPRDYTAKEIEGSSLLDKGTFNHVGKGQEMEEQELKENDSHWKGGIQGIPIKIPLDQDQKRKEIL